jgi:hypothetical protein
MNSGVFAVGQRGLRSLGISAHYAYNSGSGVYDAVTYNPPQSGSVAVELANQAGGFALLTGQQVAPLVNASQCPSFSAAQTYQYLTIPGGLSTVSGGEQGGWNPSTDTAYGSVDISTTGGNVSFQNNHQYTLPSVGGSGAPAQPAASSTSGICALTLLGNLINVPGQLIITDPGLSSSVPPQATMGIGPSGLLVENNEPEQPATGQTLNYNNLLGAGTGAVGLPKPSSALDTGSLTGSQYLGFIYDAGYFAGSQIEGQATHLASFGFPSVPPSCNSIAPASSTLIYGGNFPNDDPSTSSTGFGNCDFALDLGPQSTTSNGLYPQATVWVGSSYPTNTALVTGCGSSTSYCFPAVAIAGQLNGKYAIFVLGVDSTQPWAVYLLQSN